MALAIVMNNNHFYDLMRKYKAPLRAQIILPRQLILQTKCKHQLQCVTVISHQLQSVKLYMFLFNNHMHAYLHAPYKRMLRTAKHKVSSSYKITT